MKKITFSEHSYFSELISEEPILIDIGACLGTFTKHFIGNYPKAQVILIEPSKSNFKRIDIEDNRVRKLFGALSNKKESLIFKEDPNSEQNGSLLFDYFNNAIEYQVETHTLDELCKDFKSIDLIKMDIEGAEWDSLMETSEETFHKIKQITVEFHDFLDPSLRKKSERCVERLISLGFSIDYNPTTYMYGSKYYDSLFYKKN
jgi:FkbM family methyltransferase